MPPKISKEVTYFFGQYLRINSSVSFGFVQIVINKSFSSNKIS
jgi:hypothetical protein